MKKINTVMMTRISLGICLNVVGAWIAATFKIPIFMDSIGTIFILGLYGPKAAMITGLLGSFVSGITFDIYSLYYMPAQICTALSGAWILNQKKPQRLFFLCGIPTAIASAIITALLFGGITSSASTIFVILFNKAGMPLSLAIFLFQVIFDCLDKGLAMILMSCALQVIKRREHVYAKI